MDLLYESSAELGGRISSEEELTALELYANAAGALELYEGSAEDHLTSLLDISDAQRTLPLSVGPSSMKAKLIKIKASITRTRTVAHISMFFTVFPLVVRTEL
jgi:hypothetical protein